MIRNYLLHPGTFNYRLLRLQQELCFRCTIHLPGVLRPFNSHRNCDRAPRAGLRGRYRYRIIPRFRGSGRRQAWDHRLHDAANTVTVPENYNNLMANLNTGEDGK